MFLANLWLSNQPLISVGTAIGARVNRFLSYQVIAAANRFTRAPIAVPTRTKFRPAFLYSLSLGLY